MYNEHTHWEYLTDHDGKTLWRAKAMTNGTAYYSAKVNTQHQDIANQGLFIALAGGAPDVDISYAVSLTGEDGTWFTPYDVNGNNLSVICTTLTASRYIELDLVCAPFVRFLCDPDADSTVTIAFTSKIWN